MGFFPPPPPRNAGIFDITSEQIKPILDLAQENIERCIKDLAIPARLIRKERAVGLIPTHQGDRLPREALDETALTVQAALKAANVQTPFCAFNGGNDVFVDIGNKSIGIRGLLLLTDTDALHCLHVGDQFLTQGNDIACRFVTECASACAPVAALGCAQVYLRTVLQTNSSHRAPTRLWFS
jgi:IMP and pyridine-specific 5'-nucleotidase